MVQLTAQWTQHTYPQVTVPSTVYKKLLSGQDNLLLGPGGRVRKAYQGSKAIVRRRVDEDTSGKQYFAIGLYGHGERETSRTLIVTADAIELSEILDVD